MINTATIKRLTVILLVIAAAALSAGAQTSQPTSQAWAKSPNYAKASAHNPMYEDRTLWPEWVSKTAFVKEQWPKARVLVYAHAGVNKRGNFDLSDPANWLEDGKPATEGPDANTDIVFPAASKRYNVADGKGCDCRHMTVEPGVSAFLKSISVHGNMWIKDGASWHAINVRGQRDTFMRNDAPAPNMAANKIAFNKPPAKSTEWVGTWNLGDELDLFSGVFIVAPDSTFMPGDRSTQHIYPNGTLVLNSGSSFYKRANQYWGDDLAVRGKILAGTPDRPLTRDCTIGLSFKAKGKGGISQASKSSDMGMIIYKDGSIAVNSADPAKARLVFKWHHLPPSSDKRAAGEPDVVKSMDHGIDMILLGQVQFNGVEFNDVLKGGISMPDPDARKQWKNVTFGKNFADESGLFVKYTGNMNIQMKDDGVAESLAKEAAKGKPTSKPAVGED
jgi:hypothetical protein